MKVLVLIDQVRRSHTHAAAPIRRQRIVDIHTEAACLKLMVAQLTAFFCQCRVKDEKPAQTAAAEIVAGCNDISTDGAERITTKLKVTGRTIQTSTIAAELSGCAL